MRLTPFLQRSKSCFDGSSPTSLGLFADMQMMAQGSGHKLPLVDQTAPNTPTGNEFSFMSPRLTPKKFENVPILALESVIPQDDQCTSSTTVVMKAGK